MLSAVELELVFVTKVELVLYVFCCGASVRLCFITAVYGASSCVLDYSACA